MNDVKHIITSNKASNLAFGVDSVTLWGGIINIRRCHNLVIQPVVILFALEFGPDFVHQTAIQ